MTLPASGTLTFTAIATEFSGSTPYSISDYYAGGSLVPSSNTGVPTSGTISFSEFYGASANTTVTYDTNTFEVNLYDDAVAAGYDPNEGGTVNVVINSGVEIIGVTTHAITSGEFPANTTLNVTNNGEVKGYTGATASSAGANGGAGGDAFYANFVEGATVTITNNNIFGGGGGGGGGYGVRQTEYNEKGNSFCAAPSFNGSNGSAGALGTAGSAGTYGGGSSTCITTSIGSGGTSGYAVRKNGRTLTTVGSFSGTVG